jgi:hypothetical protein
MSFICKIHTAGLKLTDLWILQHTKDFSTFTDKTLDVALRTKAHMRMDWSILRQYSHFFPHSSSLVPRNICVAWKTCIQMGSYLGICKILTLSGLLLSPRLRRWDPFIGEVQQEWETFILFVSGSFYCEQWFEIPLQATVLLTASVSFLTIPHNKLAHGDSQTRIASYLSILTGIGSIITGLVLARRHRNKDGSAKQIVSLSPDVN